MISSNPSERLSNYQPRPPKRPFFSQIPWTVLVALVFLFGLGGWAWYHFQWSNRLPQVHALTDKRGQTQQVRLDAHNDLVLQYTLLADNSVHYVAISSLANVDQAYVLSLPSSLQLGYPFECAMEEPDAALTLLRIEGRNSDWVRYVRMSDHTTHYAPLRSFSGGDQTILKQLPEAINITPPVQRKWSDLAGNLLPGSIEARSYEAVKLTATNGDIFYIPIRDLSLLDQSLVRLMPMGMSLSYPLNCILTDKNGKQLNAQLQGRSSNAVKYMLAGDSLVYCVPLTNLSTRDRTFIRTLPSNLDLAMPFTCALFDVKGQPIRARVEAQGNKLVKFTNLDSNLTFYWPNRMFSSDTLEFLQLLPTGLSLALPLDATLTSQTGQDVSAHILGHDNTAVNFVSPDGKTYTYELAKLSQESQEFILKLPMGSLAPANRPLKTASASSQSTTLDYLRSQLENLISIESTDQAKADEIKSHVGAPVAGLANTDINSVLQQVDLSMDQIEQICLQINPLVDMSPKQGKDKLAQNAWRRIMGIIKSDNELRTDVETASPTFRELKRNELRKNQADLLGALREIKSYLGAYTPPAAATPAAP